MRANLKHVSDQAKTISINKYHKMYVIDAVKRRKPSILLSQKNG